MTNALYSGISENSRPAFQGQWFNIRLRPDLFTGEILNVGVGLVTAKGKILVRHIKDIGRIECLYGEEAAENTMMLVKAVNEFLSSCTSETLRSPSPNIAFSELKYVAGDSSEQLLDDLFSETVTVARPRENVTEPRTQSSVPTEKLRATVYDFIRNKTALAAEKIIPETPALAVTSLDGRSRAVDIPLQGARRFGGLESAWYKTPNHVELKLLKALTDLETAAKIKQVSDLALFVGRPSPASGFANQNQLDAIENVIDAVAWRAQSQGLLVEVEDDEEKLADRVINWAELAA